MDHSDTRGYATQGMTGGCCKLSHDAIATCTEGVLHEDKTEQDVRAGLGTRARADSLALAVLCQNAIE